MAHVGENLIKMREAFDILDSIDEDDDNPMLAEAKAMLENAIAYHDQERDWEWK